MYIQVITARVDDWAAVRRRLDVWLADVAPITAGWLGTTAGATDDGRFVSVSRYDTVESVRASADLAEQQAWWSATKELFADVSSGGYDTTVLLRGGGSDDAGFVQVIRGHAGDAEALRRAMQDAEDFLIEHRADVIGAGVGVAEDGEFTQTVYFTSEAAARDGERRMADLDDDAGIGDMLAGAEFFDLRDPWLASP